MIGRFKIREGKGYEWQTFIYVMQDSEGCKFGITNDMERKQKQYSKERPTLKLKYCKPLKDRNIARLVEFKMKIHFPIIRGAETTSAPLEELVEFIESSNLSFDEAMLELPKKYQPLGESDFEEEITTKVNSEKSYTLDDKRKLHKNAYFPWTKSDDEELHKLFREGITIAELGEIFGRKSSAIEARLEKLGIR